jgi:hypothetical protein
MLRKALAVLLVAALTALLPAMPAPASTSRYGHTAAADRVLRPHCHNYRYSYRVKAPTNDWTLETYLRDSHGEGVASGVLSADSEPRRGHARFRICRYSTRPGRFTIRAKLTWYDGGDGGHRVWFVPSHFRLRRPA